MTCWSSLPIDQANPELVVASAGKPIFCNRTADPTSHGFGITKNPSTCSSWKTAHLSITSPILTSVTGPNCEPALSRGRPGRSKLAP